MWRIFFFVFLLSYLACTRTATVKTGMEAYEAGQYSVAVELLKDELERENAPDIKSEKSFWLGRSLERMNKPDESLQWFKLSAETDPSLRNLSYLAYGLKNTGHYPESKAVFQQLSQELNDINRFRVELISLDNAIAWEKDKSDNEFKIKSSPLNSMYNDYVASLDSTGKIIFTSDRPGLNDEKYLWTGLPYSGVFFADSNATEALQIPGIINSKDNDGLLVFSNDYRELVFCRCFDVSGFDQYCKLMYSSKIGDNWTTAKQLPFVYDSLNYLSAVFSEDNKILFFTMEDPGVRTGFDIYYTVRQDSLWGEPVKLPPSVNTDYHEKYISLDQDTLYFASDNPNGMGGLDIYKTYFANGRWMPPINLKAPINSAYDDFGFVVRPNYNPIGRVLQKGWFTSNRTGGKGGDDLYAFTKLAPVVTTPKVDTPIAEDGDLLVMLNVLLYGFPIENNEISSVSAPLLNGNVRIQTGSRDTTLNSDRNGRAKVLLTVKEMLEITGSKEGYLTSSRNVQSDVIRIDSSKAYQEFTIRLNLQPVIFGKEILIKDIFYDLDKYNIRKDAEGSLDELLSILKHNPQYHIRLSSHTDCRGTDEYNMRLSTQRAKSVVTYLTTKGIDSNRLSFIGYGETRPVNTCACAECSEDEHQANRRTTFELVE